MAVDVDNFLLSLAVALAAEAEPALALGNALFVHQANESDVTGTAYGVLAMYGGPTPDELPGAFDLGRPQTRSIQCRTVGKLKGGAAARAAGQLAERIFAALYDEDELVRHYWRIAAMAIDATTGAIGEENGGGEWEVQLITVRQPPGKMGPDEDGRMNWVFNFDVRFERKE